MQRVVSVSASMGFHTLLARIAEPNPPSSALHRSVGFRPVGTMRGVGYKFDRFIDVTLWQIELEDGH
jgi:phosphinothricin acetyltransferase